MKYFLLAAICLLGIKFDSLGQTLPVPSVAEGATDNYFKAGTADGGTLNNYNVFLKLHWGIALGSPYASNGQGGYTEKATVAVDARSGDINTIGNVTASNVFISNVVGIGTTDTKGYMFGVNGKMIANSVTVKLYGNWADYVFRKDYRLPHLSTIKTYIDQNHHLPEIPSEKDIAESGINLGEMNKLLLKKVEELTLYVIEQNKNYEDLRKQNQRLTESLKSQQKEVNKLKKIILK
jgi:hypothetical protein